jgi:hypothetical protein
MHGQTRSAQQPLWYTTGIVFDWMGGKNILFHEAEGSCEHAKSTCSVGLHIYEDEFQPWANHSHGGGIQVSPSMGPGILFDDYLPAEVAALPDGHEITAMAVIELTSKPMSPETIVGSLSYLDDSGNITKEWLGSDLFAELMLPQDAANGLKQYYATQITFTKGANGRLFVATEGEIEFMLDAIVFQY